MVWGRVVSRFVREWGVQPIQARVKWPLQAALIPAGLIAASCSGSTDNAPAPQPQANTAPTISAPSTVSIEENSAIVLTVTGSDPDGDSLNFSTAGGADRSKFAINPSTGRLTTRESLDFEHPSDADGNNVYEVEVSVSDGTESKSVAVAVTVTNVPNDGVTRISGEAAGDNLGAALSTAPDYDRDGTRDLFISTSKRVPGDPQTEDVSYLLFASSLATENSQTIALDAITAAQGVEFFVNGLTSGISRNFGPLEIVEGAANPPLAAIGSYNLINHPLVPIGSSVTAIFRESILDIQSAGGRIDLNAAPLFSGLRSAGNNVGPTSLRSIAAVGDLNGDTVSDVVADVFTIERNNAGVIEFLQSDFLFISGREILRGAQGLFDVDEVESRVAVVLTDEKNTLQIPLDAQDDVNGDGADDLLLYSATSNELSLQIISGAAIFSDPDGFVRSADLTAPDFFEIKFSNSNYIAQSGNTADFDGDGKVDILTSRAISGAADQVVIIYNEGFVNDADGVIEFEDIPDNQKALIEAPSNGFVAAHVVDIGDIDGGGADDFLVGAAAQINFASASEAFVVLGESIDKQDSGVISLTSSTTADVAHIIAPPLETATGLISDNFGVEAVRIADIDGDGHRELAVSAPLSGFGDGSAFDHGVGAVFVIPSRRILSAIETGLPINLGNEL